jgi:hypothetical protein
VKKLATDRLFPAPAQRHRMQADDAVAEGSHAARTVPGAAADVKTFVVLVGVQADAAVPDAAFSFLSEVDVHRRL